MVGFEEYIRPSRGYCEVESLDVSEGIISEGEYSLVREGIVCVNIEYIYRYT